MISNLFLVTLFVSASVIAHKTSSEETTSIPNYDDESAVTNNNQGWGDDRFFNPNIKNTENVTPQAEKMEDYEIEVNPKSRFQSQSGKQKTKNKNNGDEQMETEDLSNSKQNGRKYKTPIKTVPTKTVFKTPEQKQSKTSNDVFLQTESPSEEIFQSEVSSKETEITSKKHKASHDDEFLQHEKSTLESVDFNFSDQNESSSKLSSQEQKSSNEYLSKEQTSTGKPKGSKIRKHPKFPKVYTEDEESKIEQDQSKEPSIESFERKEQNGQLENEQTEQESQSKEDREEEQESKEEKSRELEIEEMPEAMPRLSNNQTTEEPQPKTKNSSNTCYEKQAMILLLILLDAGRRVFS